MTEEFNLSDNIFTPKGLDEREGFHFIRDKYVKEFIRKLIEEAIDGNCDEQYIKRLAGDKLI